MLRLALIVGGGIILVLVGLADQHELLIYEQGKDLGPEARAAAADLRRYDGQWTQVVSVTDGDTLRIDLADEDGEPTRVRLWGIDTPERERRLADGTTVPAEPGAEAAYVFAEDLADGQRVRLRLVDTRTRGGYGRLLAYVELPDGTLLNERLLEAGLAEAVDKWEHPMVERFGLIQLQAQREGLGLWSDDSGG